MQKSTQKTAQNGALVFTFLLLIFLIFTNNLFSQNVAVTDDDSYTAASSAMLDVKSNSKGLLIPRLTTIQREAINPAAKGLMVFDTDKNAFYYYNGEEWLALPQVSSSTAVSDALFAVKNSLGDTIFAVYNDGVKVVVPYGTKGKVGGFAVSGRSPTKAGEEEYLLVTPDSTRVFVNEVDVKGKVGGFAVSGRSPSKSILKDYFVSTSDSTRIYVEESAKGTVGGFAVSGRSPTKESSIKFLDLTPNNYFIGHESGLKTTGLYNIFLGYKAGKSNATGSRNIFIGDSTGISNLTGHRNLFMGYHAGYSNYSGVENIIIGYRAGFLNYGGGYNTFVGNSAGEKNSYGTYNVFIGVGTGGFNTNTSFLTMVGVNAGHFTLSGQGNAFFGCNAGWIHENGGNNTYIGTDAGRGGNSAGDYNPSSPLCTDNTFVGTSSGYHIEGGDQNVFIGASAGTSITTGSGNIFLGYMAGSSESDGATNKLYIENSSAGSSTALIYGDFSSKILQFNASVGIGKIAGYRLDVNGDINISSGYNFKINGINMKSSPWNTSVNDIYFIAGNVAIGTGPDVNYKLKVFGNTNVSGTLSSTSFSGPLTGNVTGNLTGNVEGNINGFTMGVFNLDGSGEIVSFEDGNYTLSWDFTNFLIILTSNIKAASITYWWQGQSITGTVGAAGIFDENPEVIIADIADLCGYEIHISNGETSSLCSVWLQFFNGRLVGHYTKYSIIK